MPVELDNAKAGNPRGGRRRKSRAQREADLLLIERLHLEDRKSAREIAPIISSQRPYTLSHQTISTILRKAADRWAAESAKLIKEDRDRQLKIIRLRQGQVIEQWHKSGEDAVTQRAEKVEGGSDGSGARQKTSITKEGQCKDVRYQVVALDLLKEENKILGIYAPVQTQIGGIGGGPVQTESSLDIDMSLEGLTEEQLRKIVEGDVGTTETTTSGGQPVKNGAGEGEGGGQAGKAEAD